jgi:hypothetical protein
VTATDAEAKPLVSRGRENSSFFFAKRLNSTSKSWRNTPKGQKAFLRRFQTA